MSRERTRRLDPAIDKTRPGRTEMGGSHAIAQAAPGNSDAVPLGCPLLALWWSCILPCRRLCRLRFPARRSG